MTEIKVGQWWRTRCGEIRKVVSIDESFGDYPVLSREKNDLQSHAADGKAWHDGPNHSDDLIEHLPDCTGFDWKPQPVESPDDWVEITHLRDHVIESDYEIDITGRAGWLKAGTLAGKTVGWFLSKCPEWRFRCRRKDMPHKKQRVRLWAGPPSEIIGIRCVLLSDSAPGDSWHEVMHDDDGFYCRGGGK